MYTPPKKYSVILVTSSPTAVQMHELENINPNDLFNVITVYNPSRLNEHQDFKRKSKGVKYDMLILGTDVEDSKSMFTDFGLPVFTISGLVLSNMAVAEAVIDDTIAAFKVKRKQEDSRMEPKSGLGLIVSERANQIFMHGYTLESDSRYYSRDVFQNAAIAILHCNRKEWPQDIPLEVYHKIMNKDKQGQIAVAAAFLAAEIDYINYKAYLHVVEQADGVSDPDVIGIHNPCDAVSDEICALNNIVFDPPADPEDIYGKRSKGPYTKPPLGLKPRYLVTAERIEVIMAAIKRYTKMRKPINVEWDMELKSLVKYMTDYDYVVPKEAVNRVQLFDTHKTGVDTDKNTSQPLTTHKESLTNMFESAFLSAETEYNKHQKIKSSELTMTLPDAIYGIPPTIQMITDSPFCVGMAAGTGKTQTIKSVFSAMTSPLSSWQITQGILSKTTLIKPTEFLRSKGLINDPQNIFVITKTRESGVEHINLAQLLEDYCVFNKADSEITIKFLQQNRDEWQSEAKMWKAKYNTGVEILARLRDSYVSGIKSFTEHLFAEGILLAKERTDNSMPITYKARYDELKVVHDELQKKYAKLSGSEVDFKEQLLELYKTWNNTGNGDDETYFNDWLRHHGYLPSFKTNPPAPKVYPSEDTINRNNAINEGVKTIILSNYSLYKATNSPEPKKTLKYWLMELMTNGVISCQKAYEMFCDSNRDNRHLDFYNWLVLEDYIDVEVDREPVKNLTVKAVTEFLNNYAEDLYSAKEFAKWAKENGYVYTSNDVSKKVRK